MNNLLLLVSILCLFILSMVPCTFAQSIVQQNAGVYAWTAISKDGNYTVNPKDITNPNVDGYAIGIGWNILEPSAGVYDWSSVDKILAQLPANQKLAVYVTTGAHLPAWLISQVSTIEFIWDAAFFLPYCTVVQIQVPWDNNFIVEANKLISTFGSRYNGKLVRTSMSMETNKGLDVALPWGTNEIIPKTGTQLCTGNNYFSELSTVGYTKALAESSYEQLFTSYKNAFPNTAIAGFFNPVDFPIIATQSVDGSIRKDLSAWSFATDPNFFAMNEALSDTFVFSFIRNQHTAGVPVGFQMVSVLGPLLPTAITKGIDAGATYLEIYDADINNPTLAGSIASAHHTLTGK